MPSSVRVQRVFYYNFDVSHQGEYYCLWGKLSEYLQKVLVKHPNMLANWGWLLEAWFVLTIG